VKKMGENNQTFSKSSLTLSKLLSSPLTPFVV
jgi:hypothetical protein